MSRDRNRLQRHVADCLADRWEAVHGLIHHEEDDDPWDEWAWNWGDETLDAPELRERDDWEKDRVESEE